VTDQSIAAPAPLSEGALAAVCTLPPLHLFQDARRYLLDLLLGEAQGAHHPLVDDHGAVRSDGPEARLRVIRDGELAHHDDIEHPSHGDRQRITDGKASPRYAQDYNILPRALVRFREPPPGFFAVLEKHRHGDPLPSFNRALL